MKTTPYLILLFLLPSCTPFKNTKKEEVKTQECFFYSQKAWENKTRYISLDSNGNPKIIYNYVNGKPYTFLISEQYFNEIKIYYERFPDLYLVGCFAENDYEITSYIIRR